METTTPTEAVIREVIFTIVVKVKEPLDNALAALSGELEMQLESGTPDQHEEVYEDFFGETACPYGLLMENEVEGRDLDAAELAETAICRYFENAGYEIESSSCEAHQEYEDWAQHLYDAMVTAGLIPSN